MACLSLSPLCVCACARLCVSRHNNSVFLSPHRAPGWKSGNEMEKLAQKDSLWCWNGGCNNEEFTGWYEANTRTEGWWSYSNLQPYTSIKMGVLLPYNYSLNTFTWSALRFPAARPDHATEYTSPRGGLQGLFDGSNRYATHPEKGLYIMFRGLLQLGGDCHFLWQWNFLTDTTTKSKYLLNYTTSNSQMVIKICVNYKKNKYHFFL